MALKIRRVENEADRFAAYSLRYTVYVEELKRPILTADHDLKIITDSGDEKGVIFLVEDDGYPVGTVRAGYSRDGAVPGQDNYQPERFAPYFPELATFTGALVVRKEYRNSMAAFLLSMECYKRAVDSGCRFDFINCAPYLVRVYQQMGYRFYTSKNFYYENFRFTVMPMVLVYRDLEYLKEVRSPFMKYARKLEHDPEAADFYVKNFPKYSHTRPFLVSSTDTILEELSSHVSARSNAARQLRRKLGGKRGQTIIKEIDMLTLREGDIVFRKGDVSNGLYYIMNGQAEVLAEINGQEVAIDVLHQYETFGDLDFLSRRQRQYTVRISQDAELLVFNDKSLNKLTLKDPNIVLQLMRNLISHF